MRYHLQKRSIQNALSSVVEDDIRRKVQLDAECGEDVSK